MVVGGGDEMRTAWPDRIADEVAPSAVESRVDWARLGAWIAVIGLALGFWVAAGVLVAVLV